RARRLGKRRRRNVSTCRSSWIRGACHVGWGKGTWGGQGVAFGTVPESLGNHLLDGTSRNHEEPKQQ
nr:hypothetical protein [Tanacetum cinerariifolium]